jgi:hypothetical protein
VSERLSTSTWHHAAAERQVAEALFASGRLSESRAHAERALALLGRPMPQGHTRLLIALLAQLLRQIRNRLWLHHFSGYPPETQAALLETTRAYALLGQIYRRKNETLPVIFITVRRVNLCEHADASPELAEAYADMSALCRRVGLRALAEVYARQVCQSPNK